LLEAPVLVSFVGGLGGSPVEEMTAAARRAATLDSLERALSTGAFAYAVLVADATFLDSRVILAHLGLEPSRADRFLSDLGRYEEIEDPFLRQLSEGAARAAIPVALGGHSLVSGGLMALIDHAWQEHDRVLQQRGGVDLGRGVE